MAIPDFQSFMLPLLKFTADKKEHSITDTVDKLSNEFNLSEEEKRALLPSGTQEIVKNRISWAVTYFKKAALLESQKRAHFNITSRGIEVLKQNPDRINIKFLNQYEEFKKFHESKKETSSGIVTIDDTNKTPEEIFENAYEGLRAELAAEIQVQLMKCPPSYFEKIVIEILVKMGYGGSLKDAGKAVGKTGDEGIDGIIKEDKLGLDIIYIQAKRWTNTVSRPEIQKFAGALQGQRAKKGIFITTSDFSKEAKEYVSKIESKIILIDGEQLAEFMIDFNVGTTTSQVYEIKKVDLDYFIEE